MATKIKIPDPTSTVTGAIDAFDDLASTIADPGSKGPLRAAIGRSGQLMCDLVGSNPTAAGIAFGAAAPFVSLLCEPYFERSEFDGPTNDAPFTGGQCDGTLYQYLYVYVPKEGQVSTAAVNANQKTWGPITGFRTQKVGSLFKGFLTSRGVATASSCAVSQPVISTLQEREIFSVTYRGQDESGSFSITGVCSGVDTCGDPEQTPIPGPNPPPTPVFPPGLEPGVDPDGQPFFFVPPIDDPLGGDPIDVPEEEPAGGGGGGDPGGPTEPPVAGGEEEGSGSGDDEFPPPPDGRRWVGCCIRLTTVPQGTGTVPGTAPETILTQVVGNARLLFDSVSGDGYDTPVQIRSAGLCLWEPVKGLSPKGVRVNLKPGFQYAYTPFSVEDTE